jgi:hypothetical protein
MPKSFPPYTATLHSDLPMPAPRFQRAPQGCCLPFPSRLLVLADEAAEHGEEANFDVPAREVLPQHLMRFRLHEKRATGIPAALSLLTNLSPTTTSSSALCRGSTKIQ